MHTKFDIYVFIISDNGYTAIDCLFGIFNQRSCSYSASAGKWSTSYTCM